MIQEITCASSKRKDSPTYTQTIRAAELGLHVRLFTFFPPQQEMLSMKDRWQRLLNIKGISENFDFKTKENFPLRL